MQGLVDANLNFKFYDISFPGSVADGAAHEANPLGEVLNNARLPKPIDVRYGVYRHADFDGAYPSSRHSVVPYEGRRLPPHRDGFNFFHSSERMPIE